MNSLNPTLILTALYCIGAVSTLMFLLFLVKTERDCITLRDFLCLSVVSFVCWFGVWLLFALAALYSFYEWAVGRIPSSYKVAVRRLVRWLSSPLKVVILGKRPEND